MVNDESFVAWYRELVARRSGPRIDTRELPDRRFVAYALSAGLIVVTTPPGDVPSSDAPYLLGIRLTPAGERLLARSVRA